MAVKVRDAGGVLRTITVIKVRDEAGVLREVTSWKIRDGAGVLREVFSAGGGATEGASITPGSTNTTNRSIFKSASFTAYGSGGVPSAYAWGVLSGPGVVQSGGATATALLGVYADAGGAPTTAAFYCDVTIGGTPYRATCTMTHTYVTSDDVGGA